MFGSSTACLVQYVIQADQSLSTLPYPIHFPQEVNLLARVPVLPLSSPVWQMAPNIYGSFIEVAFKGLAIVNQRQLNLNLHSLA